MRRTPRYWPLWLLPGIPLVTLAWHYRLDSDPAAILRARTALAAQASQVNQAISLADTRSQLHAVLQHFVDTDPQRTLSIQLRNGEGHLQAHAGSAAPPSFSIDFVRAQYRHQRPIFKIVHTRGSAVLVEAFPIRLAPTINGVPLLAASDGDRQELAGVIEIAVRMSASERPSRNPSLENVI